MPIKYPHKGNTSDHTRRLEFNVSAFAMAMVYKPQSAIAEADVVRIKTHQNEHTNRHSCRTRRKKHPNFGFSVSARLRGLCQKQGGIVKETSKNVLISRGHICITMRPRMLGSCRCHLSSFFLLPLFRVKRKAKTPKVRGRGKEVGCGCETDGRVMGTKGFRSSSKLTFWARGLRKKYSVHSGSRIDMKPKPYGNK